MKNNYINLAENLRELRILNNFSQQEIADKLYFTRQTWSNYECGKHQPDMKTLIKISKIFNCSMEYLIFNNSMSNRYLDLKSTISVNDTISYLEKYIPGIEMYNSIHKKEIEKFNLTISNNLKEIEKLNKILKT